MIASCARAFWESEHNRQASKDAATRSPKLNPGRWPALKLARVTGSVCACDTDRLPHALKHPPRIFTRAETASWARV